MKKSTIQENIAYSEHYDNWDRYVFGFLENISLTGKKLRYLEVGSGLCEFPCKLAKRFPNLEITCIEINPDLAAIAASHGFRVITDNVLNVTVTEQYDVVHCSHVIEHFAYPQVAQLLDFLSASTYPDGYLIIRAPLMWEKFYHDLDHVRPYPPEAIMNYFNLEQQQKKGDAKLGVVAVHYITNPLQYKHLERWNILYATGPLRKAINKTIDLINRINHHLWRRYRFPAEKPRGFILITQKTNVGS